tara:strand:+ start:272 stop:1072 length:801 start_codon:yes stop_codon:yes gene_type:complete
MKEIFKEIDSSLEYFLQLGIEALDKSRQITQNINFADSNLKKDGSLITKYDLLTEEKIFEILSKSDADIVTEEVLSKENNSEYCWYVDPIDGTTSFSRGIPLYGTIIGLTFKGEPIMGLIDIPKLNDRFVSVKNNGTFKNSNKIKSSNESKLSKSIITYGSPQRFIKEGLIDQLHQIDSLVWESRGYADCFGYSLAFSGAVDLAIEVDLNPWETIALENLSIESGAGYAENISISGKKSGKKNIIIGSKNLIEETINIFGGDWKIK